MSQPPETMPKRLSGESISAWVFSNSANGFPLRMESEQMILMRSRIMRVPDTYPNARELCCDNQHANKVNDDTALP